LRILERIMVVELEEKIVDVLAKLQSQAAARSMPFDAYLAQFVADEPAVANGGLALDEFDLVLGQLAAEPPKAPPLPADFSRADIYADHN
jgi:hypothetical protein